MWIKRSRTFILSLILTASLCLTSCMQTSYDFCPVYPIAGEKVAKELENAGDIPNTWEWMGRINKLRQELELCK